MQEPPQRYDSVAQALHWLIFSLVVVQIYFAVASFRANDPVREFELLGWHRPLGITILGLMLLRLAWRFLHTPPPPPQNLGVGLRWVSRVNHWLLYMLLIAIPVVGWAKAGAEGIEVGYFGLFAVPNWVGENPAVVQSLRMAHLYLNTALLVSVPVHILAALWHAAWLRDGLVRRMLPINGN